MYALLLRCAVDAGLRSWAPQRRPCRKYGRSCPRLFLMLPMPRVPLLPRLPRLPRLPSSLPMAHKGLQQMQQPLLQWRTYRQAYKCCLMEALRL